MDIHHEFVRNRNIDKIRRRFLIKVQSGIKFEWYIIDEINDNTDDNSKEVHAFSLGYELTDKKVIRYECVSYNATQVLHDALSETIWTTGYIDSKFDVKYRSFNISSKNVLDFVYEIANTFGALVVFDVENRTVNFYDLENYGLNKGLYLSYDKYLSNLNKVENLDNIKTRLKIFGRDGMSIQEVNITGQNYIEDFSYYMYPFERDENRNVLKHSAYGMSDDLCHAILDYNELLISKQGEFQGYLDNKKSLQQTRTTKQNELIALQDELAIILDNIDVAQANNLPYGDLYNQKIQKESEINTKQAELDDVNNQLSAVMTSINNLHTQLKVENNYTPEQIIELNPFIIVEEWTDNNYIDAQDLYDDGVKRLNELKIGTPVIEVDIINFLKIVTAQRDWDKLNIGDIIFVQFEKFNVEIQAKVIEINYQDDDIKLTISNIKDILNDKEKFLKMIQTSINTSTEVNMDRFKWNGADARVNSVEAILNNEWNTVRQRIVSGVDESVIVDRRGITITSPTNPNSLLRAVAGIIGCSDDGGNTFKNALTGEGTIADRLIGQILIGQNLIIDASNNEGKKFFTVNETGVKISGLSLQITDGGLPVSELAEGVLLENKLYNGVKIDITDGLTITRSDNKVRSISNATDGFSIEKWENSDWTKKLYADTDGNLILKGHMQIGSGSSIFKADNNGIYSGSSNFNYAPFRVDLLGNLTATSANIQGNIDCSSLKIAGINVLDELNRFNGNYLSKNSVGADKLKVNELIVGDNITMGPNAYISWNKVTSKPDVATKSDIPTIPSYIQSTRITGTSIESCTITGNTIQTAYSGARIVMSDNTFRCVNSSNYWHGVAIDQQNSLFYLAIYNNGYYKGYLGIDESDSNRVWLRARPGVRLKVESGHDMSIRCPSSNTMWLGEGNIRFIAGTNVDFSGANVTNLSGTTAVAVFG